MHTNHSPLATRHSPLALSSLVPRLSPLLLLLLLLLLALPATAAEENAEKSSTKLVTPAAEQAIDRGLKWLVAQQHDDGSFGSGQFRGNVAITALSGMAMLSNGSTPGRGAYGTPLKRAIDAILAACKPSGFIESADAGHGPMYGHGFATMFLAECHGMSPRSELRDKLGKAVKIILSSQNKEGGWRYQPVRADADISVTVCQIMALRAAKNAGIFVPADAINKAIDYVKRSQNADGGFMYMIQGGESAFPRSAAAVAALYSAGIYKGPEITKGLDYLDQFLPTQGGERRESYYYYAQYYAAQTMWQAGGARWRKWYAAARDDLLSRQREDGSWLSAEGGECGTAMALIALQMPNNYLPIFQR